MYRHFPDLILDDYDKYRITVFEHVLTMEDDYVAALKFYDVEMTPLSMRDVLHVPKHPLEKVIFKIATVTADEEPFTQKDIEEMASLFRYYKMVPPEYLFQTNPMFDDYYEYFTDNYAGYRRLDPSNDTTILPAEDNLDLFTDHFLITKLLEAVPVYSNRRELLEAARRIVFPGGQETDLPITEAGSFFYPLQRHCYNPKTLDLVYDAYDDFIYIIAFGTKQNYVCYQPHELIAAFNINEETERITFELPFPVPEETLRKLERARGFGAQEEALQHQRRTLFLEPDKAEELLKLINQIDVTIPKEYSCDMTALLERIEQYLAQFGTKPDTEYDQEMLQEFDQFTSEVKELIKDVLVRIFENGMYMRQWRGPGQPWPIKEAQTKAIKGFDPDEAMEEHNRKFMEAIDALRERDPSKVRFVYKLQAATIENKKLVTLTAPIKKFIKNVLIHNECIRMNSIYWVVTGYKYLKLFYNYTFTPYLDIKNLASIE